LCDWLLVGHGGFFPELLARSMANWRGAVERA
jgi:hypothetical protein